MADRSHKTRQKLTFRIAPIRPRNPLVAAAMKRSAGPHRKSTGAVRAATRSRPREPIDPKDEDDGGFS